MPAFHAHPRLHNPSYEVVFVKYVSKCGKVRGILLFWLIIILGLTPAAVLVTRVGEGRIGVQWIVDEVGLCVSNTSDDEEGERETLCIQEIALEFRKANGSKSPLPHQSIKNSQTRSYPGPSSPQAHAD
jgi:hypothetical protein